MHIICSSEPILIAAIAVADCLSRSILIFNLSNVLVILLSVVIFLLLLLLLVLQVTLIAWIVILMILRLLLIVSLVYESISAISSWISSLLEALRASHSMVIVLSLSHRVIIVVISFEVSLGLLKSAFDSDLLAQIIASLNLVVCWYAWLSHSLELLGWFSLLEGNCDLSLLDFLLSFIYSLDESQMISKVS